MYQYEPKGPRTPEDKINESDLVLVTDKELKDRVATLNSIIKGKDSDEVVNKVKG